MFMPDLANPNNPPLVYYIHADHLNAPRIVVDRNGARRWRWLAEPFGTTAPETNPDGLGVFTQNLRFPGQYTDAESGLWYNYFRSYDSSRGGYPQSDPIGLAGGVNTYAYVGGNPLSFTDPAGLFCQNANDGTTTCVNPAGPVFRLPTPVGFPNMLWPDDPFYHLYDIGRSIGCADPAAVFQALVDNPTPGDPKPATTGGTINNAVVLWQDNIVTSYVTKDLVTNESLEVNITGSVGLFGPGYVVRYVQNGVAHTAGEGTNYKQSNIATKTLQRAANEALWGRQMSRLIEQCGCKKGAKK
jgi:RHS repeat-associated protein